jgi:hypothetical protein
MRNLAKLQKGEHILGLINISFEKDRCRLHRHQISREGAAWFVQE